MLYTGHIIWAISYTPYHMIPYYMDNIILTILYALYHMQHVIYTLSYDLFKLFKFYKNIGMEITNLQLAIQYSKDKPLKRFIEKMVECRKQADRNNQKDLVQIYKLVVNS